MMPYGTTVDQSYGLRLHGSWLVSIDGNTDKVIFSTTWAVSKMVRLVTMEKLLSDSLVVPRQAVQDRSHSKQERKRLTTSCN